MSRKRSNISDSTSEDCSPDQVVSAEETLGDIGPVRRRSARIRTLAVQSETTAPESPDTEGQDRLKRTRIKRLDPKLLEAVAELTQLGDDLQRHARREQKRVRMSPLRVAKESRGATQLRTVDGRMPGKTLRADNSAEESDSEGDARMIDGLKGITPGPPPITQSLVPWNGRLGYACLNTYLRSADPAVFCSRTCRVATIQIRSHPLTDPTQPFHATKNPFDTTKPSNPSRGLAYVQSLGLANARDIIPILRWNAKNNIRFMRLSSEMFPFASHQTHGYKLDFAKEILSNAGRVAAELNHRVTTHPGQYTQLGSPRPEVVRAAILDLEYHNQMLELMALPDQLDRDAVMIIHMGGMFGDKEATLKRFTEAYKGLRPEVKRRLVLENDDAGWAVLDLLPTCEALDIPLVLDWHHHTISYSEGMTGSYEELLPLLPRIAQTWKKKNITQKMHYSEPALLYNDDGSLASPRDRRKHSSRVYNLPPWRSEEPVDLCIEAKDKEQAVFELMKRFQGNGWAWQGVSDIIPHTRADNAISKDDRPSAPLKKEEMTDSSDDSELWLDLGGVDKRVYWPEGMEAWLKPKKRARKVKVEEVQSQSDGADVDEE